MTAITLRVYPSYDGDVVNGYFIYHYGDERNPGYWTWNPTPLKSDDYITFYVGVVVHFNDGNYPDATEIMRGYLDFVKTKPYRFIITQDKLSLYVESKTGSLSVTAVKLPNLASSYSAANLYAAIGSGTAYSSAISVPASGNWMEIPLNALAKSDLIANGRLSIGLRSSNESSGVNYASFYTTENGSDIPYLDIIGKRFIGQPS